MRYQLHKIMCGFIGILNLSGQLPPESETDSRRMAEAISHRGPDGSGRYVDDFCILEHRRLSIIDVENGSQPWVSECGRYHLVFNGEIYNHKELRSDLEKRGHHYTSHCDTESILHAYIEWGAACVEQFRGMFAFAIWDKNKNTLFCARDRLGVKPFYYYVHEGTIIFSSEIKGILENRVISKEIDEDALVDYLRLGYYPAPKCAIKGVRKLESAHTLLFSESGIEKNCYWELESATPNQEKNNNLSVSFFKEVESLIESSTKCRMESEVPIGALLSGGLDSSIISYVSSALSPLLRTFSISFRSKKYDESTYAKMVADTIASNHTELQVELDVPKELEHIIWHMDEPFADASAIPTYYLCRGTKKHISVAISGDGADELFAGYEWYNRLSHEGHVLKRFPRWLKRLLNWLGNKDQYHLYRGGAYLRNMGVKQATQHSNLRSIFSDKLIKSIVNKNGQPFSQHPIETEYQRLGGVTDNVLLAQLVDMKLYLGEGILSKVDKISSAFGLEVRSPFLDHKLIEYVVSHSASIPVEQRKNKSILKAIAKNRLPEVIIERRKQGFTPPLRAWLLNEFRAIAEEYFLKPSRFSGLFDNAVVSKLWNDFVLGERKTNLQQGYEDKLWTLLCFEIWYDINIRQGGQHVPKCGDDTA